MTIDKVTIKEDWDLISEGNNTYVLETAKDKFDIGHHDIMTIVFYKILTAEECHVEGNYIFEKVSRKCSIYKGNYYNNEGFIVDHLTYQKECERNICTQLSDGTYFGKDGIEVDKLTYQKECEHILEKMELK